MDAMNSQPTILISEITVKTERGRQDFDKDKMQELMESITKYGVIQPIVLTDEMINGKICHVLVAGQRRMLASLRLGLARIPYCWKEQLPPLQQKRIELEENVCRADMSWPEKNEMIRQIIEIEQKEKGIASGGEVEGFKVQNLADKMGVTLSSVVQKANFAEDCKDRPDIFALVKHMNESAAKNKFQQIKESERVQELHAKGEIVLVNEFKNGDTRELIKEIRSESIDLLLSDTPFAIPDLEGDRGDTQTYTQQLKPTDNLTVGEMEKLLDGLAPEWFRVLKPSAHVWLFFGWDVYEYMFDTLTKVGFEVERVPIIWDKLSTTGAFKGYSGAPCYEQILLAHKPPRTKRINEPFKNILAYKPVSKVSRTHLFEKPLDLLSFIIKQSTKLGDVVLDSFAGTGNVLVAAEQCGRSGIGHEIDKDHYYLGQKNILLQKAKGKS